MLARNDVRSRKAITRPSDRGGGVAGGQLPLLMLPSMLSLLLQPLLRWQLMHVRTTSAGALLAGGGGEWASSWPSVVCRVRTSSQSI